MAAVSDRTVTEQKSSLANVAVKSPCVYTRTVTFAVENGATAGTANLTGLTIPANTMVLGGAVKFSADQAGCTYKFSLTTDGDICAATSVNGVVGSFVTLATASRIVSTADRVVTYTTATAATVTGTCTLTLVLVPMGYDAAEYTTFTG